MSKDEMIYIQLDRSGNLHYRLQLGIVQILGQLNVLELKSMFGAFRKEFGEVEYSRANCVCIVVGFKSKLSGGEGQPLC